MRFLAFILALLACLGCQRARADWVPRRYLHTVCEFGHCIERQVTRRVWAPRPSDVLRSPKCHAEVTALGGQRLTKDGAREAAEGIWTGAVRTMHGELFQDLDNAKGLRHLCWRSSIAEDTIVTKALYRCRVWATPCMPDVEDVTRLPRGAQK